VAAEWYARSPGTAADDIEVEDDAVTTDMEDSPANPGTSDERSD
jgi:hypothetical protein